MGYRSGFTLLRLVEETRGRTKDEQLHEYIDAAVEFIRPGGRGTYRRGARLVDLLKRGAMTALALEEVEVAERLSDFARHAAGEIPLNLLEAYYVPNSRPAADAYARMTAEVGARRVLEGLEGFLAERPDAGSGEVRQWVHGLTASLSQLRVGTGRGGITLPRGGHDNLVYLGQIELLFEELPAHDQPLEDVLDWPHAEMLAHLVELSSRRKTIAKLRQIVADPHSSEHDIHRCLQDNYWMFGGAYIRELDVRGLTTGAVLDIPLLRGDGAMHVVELKKANVPGLLGRYGHQIRTGGAVHSAVSQAQNYLRALDEDRARLLETFGIDSRRAFATVVIGHKEFLRSGFSTDDVAETLRTYNSHLGRIEVITYDSLIESAERALALGEVRA